MTCQSSIGAHQGPERFSLPAWDCLPGTARTQAAMPGVATFYRGRQVRLIIPFGAKEEADAQEVRGD